MKIYTRTGDSGKTSLFGGGRITKGHVRLHVYGTVDEVSSILGLAVAAGLPEEVREAVVRVQCDLFVLGADLATPLEVDSRAIARLGSALTARLESEIDAWQAALPPLRSFILPGGVLGGAFLHQARTVCRRAERWLVLLSESESINGENLRYLNRLSDWLFVAARVVNWRAGVAEALWESRSGEG